MPRYYFNLSNKRCVTDPYGTVLLDKNAAMSHALVAAASWRVVTGGVRLRTLSPRGCVSCARPFKKRLFLSAMQNHNGRGGEDRAARK
jgi:hypothetical protein